MNAHDIDNQIKQALTPEDAEIYAQFAEEPSLLAQGLELLHSRNRWITALVLAMTIVLLGVGIYSLWKFFAAEETKVLIGWAMAFGCSMATISLIKIWAWMEMEKNATIREIKRLELQVARLTQRLGESK